MRDVDPERFRKITSSTLEGLAKRELNLGALLGKSAEARERRLIPEVVEEFFVAAGPIAGVHPKPVQRDGHVYRVGKLPRTLQPIGERLEPRFGRLGREYQKVVFDKALLPTDPTVEWVTPPPLASCARRRCRAGRYEPKRAPSSTTHNQRASATRRFGASVKDGAAPRTGASLSSGRRSRTLTCASPRTGRSAVLRRHRRPSESSPRTRRAAVSRKRSIRFSELSPRFARVETIARHLEISLSS